MFTKSPLRSSEGNAKPLESWADDTVWVLLNRRWDKKVAQSPSNWFERCRLIYAGGCMLTLVWGQVVQSHWQKENTIDVPSSINSLNCTP